MFILGHYQRNRGDNILMAYYKIFSGGPDDKDGNVNREQVGGETWEQCRVAADANNSGLNGASAQVGSYDDWPQIFRAFLWFDFSEVPTEEEINNATLYICPGALNIDVHFDIVIQTGQPTVHHYPCEIGDYNQANVSGNGGSRNTIHAVAYEYLAIPLNAIGRGWINKEGITKLCLRHGGDISATPPTGINEIINMYNGNGTYKPAYIELNKPTTNTTGKASMTSLVEAILTRPPVINIKAERDSTQTAVRLYGEILGTDVNITERGFEYLIQDEEPGEEDTGIKVIDEKPEHIEYWETGEYWVYEYKGNEVDFEDRLYKQEENTIWWFRAYYKDDEENKYIAETWMKNVPTLITNRCSGGIGSISLGEGGTGYEAFDNINIIQEGASGGIAKVESVDGAGIIQSISIQSRGEDYKIENGLSVTGGSGTGATINILSIMVEAQEVTANGELLDKGANIVTRRGFRIIKEYEGDLWGIREYSNSISDWTLEGEIEEEVITNEAGFITGYIWRGTFYRDALWPQSQTPGNFEVGVYQNILGGGISGEGFGFYLKPNDTYKIRAISVNSLGMGFGDEGYAYTYQRLEGGNVGKDKEGKIDIEGEGGEWEKDGSGIWWKANNILQVDEIIKTGIIILPSSESSEEDEIVSEISAEKTITLGTIPYGATVTRIGIRLGRTMGCNEKHVYEDGSWGTGESVTFFITDFVPGSTYYKIPYIIINYGDWEEEILAIPDYRDPERLEEWLEDYPVEVFPEVEEEDEDELDNTMVDSSVGDISYRTIIREIKCEKIADQSFIDKAGRRRSQTLDNHLIQSRNNCKIIIDDYIEKFQILKLKIVIDYDIPIPFEREDVILLGDGKEKYREDGQGLISFKADGEGEILQQEFILTKIRKIDGRYESGKETILGLELEV